MPKLRDTLPKRYSRGFLTRIHNGTTLGRRLNSTFGSLVLDCGGADAMTTGKLMLVERLTFLQEFLSELEQNIAADPVGKPELLGRWTQGINSMMGLVRTLKLDEDKQQQVFDALYSEDPEEAAGNGG